ncbi:Protein kinase domain,Protein kinase-like domain,Serine/threonine-protein kinase, active site [Cinara cedri]|uniref:Protein kinase domain,Protein kinase-like domain,Serine/threonine-protein kinase, active site n=1 Tax=Cinara cedri TaxID=506608 RepID=A0A5E4MMP8_9HEMI|nr:Protein kinase domain,Protein kinase-like domain,Serine/threonine-protein kinase, active site [Cinara cedri]
MNLKNETVYKSCRFWSKKKLHDSTSMKVRLKASKTIWPVPQIEQVFLPDFKIKPQINENLFMNLELISQGAFGKVYKVKQLNSDDKFYAMKILNKSLVINENGIQQVKNEVQIQSMCGHHPFIVNCPHFWQNRNQLFILSDYVGGGELLELIHKHGPLPEELCRVYFAELVIIIDFLHNAGVIYRDIKPENILLDDDGHLQLIDFGLSKWLPQGCRTSTICGTTQYMAPEVLESEYNHVIDWWSAGVLLFRMLTNQYPPKSHDEIKRDLENVSQGAANIILKLLETNPQCRLKSLHQIKKQPFFYGFDFADVMLKKYKPNEMLKKLLGETKRSSHPLHQELPRFEEFEDF